MTSVTCIEYPIVCCTPNKSFIDKLCLITKLWHFKVWKRGQILYAHKPYFLMLGHHKMFLNQGTHAWFLKIDPVQIISMCVCVYVCVSTTKAINN